MALLPTASASIDDQSGALGAGSEYLVVMSCVERNADVKPRVFASSKSLQSYHGYSPGADFVAHFIEKTRKAVMFIGLPSVTAGAIGRQNSSGMTGTSAISVAAGTSGVLEEVDGIINFLTSGTVGTSGIVANVSMDGGLTWVRVALGTNTTYTVPYLGIVISFGAGTVNAGDVYTFVTTAPHWDQAGVHAARLALAAQLKPCRSWIVVGDLQNAGDASAIYNEANAFETANQRFIVARAQVRDRLPIAQKSRLPKTMTGTPALTFAATGNTITRASGSWLADGFLVGDVATVAGTSNNNGSKPITGVTATVLTFASGIVNEGPITAAVTGSEGLTFAATSITRSSGSWLADGFRVGDTVTIAGTTSNDGTKTITALTATVLTFASGGTAEVVGSAGVTITKGETMPGWVSAMDQAFASVDQQRRIDLGLGRVRQPASLITGWRFRRPIQWPAAIREYWLKDIHIPVWRKDDGILDGWDLDLGDGNIVEYEESSVGGALAARFTCARVYGNGPVGTFIALSLTRAPETSLLSRTHNMAVANVALTVVQANTENAGIGRVLQLDSAGRATADSLTKLEEKVNKELAANLLVDKFKEGPRASNAVWAADRTNILNVPGATLTGVLTLNLNGTIEQIVTTVKVS